MELGVLIWRMHTRSYEEGNNLQVWVQDHVDEALFPEWSIAECGECAEASDVGNLDITIYFFLSSFASTYTDLSGF